MIKYFIISVVFIFLFGCASLQPIDTCKEEILDTFVDHELTVVAWVDTDCDGECDRADYYGFEDNVYMKKYTSTCEDADKNIQKYQDQFDAPVQEL